MPIVLTRLLVGLLMVLLAVAGCVRSPASFKATDITGAAFARELALTDHDIRALLAP